MSQGHVRDDGVRGCATQRRGLRLVPRHRPRLALAGVASPELLAVLHFTLLTVLRPSAAPVGVADDLRLAVDEVLGSAGRPGERMQAEVEVDGRTATLALTVCWDLDARLHERVAPLVDDLETRREGSETLVTMRRSW